MFTVDETGARRENSDVALEAIFTRFAGGLSIAELRYDCRPELAFSSSCNWRRQVVRRFRTGWPGTHRKVFREDRETLDKLFGCQSNLIDGLASITVFGKSIGH